MKPIVREMYEFLVRMQQSPFTQEEDRADIEELLGRATRELLEPELVVDEGEPSRLNCHLFGLGVKVGDPTVTGRIYGRELLEAALEEKKHEIDNGKVLVFNKGIGYYRGVQCLSDVIGVVKSMRLNDEGELVGSAVLIETKYSGGMDVIKMLLDNEKLAFSVGGVGRVESDGVVHEYEMTHVDLVPNPPVLEVDASEADLPESLDRPVKPEGRTVKE